MLRRRYQQKTQTLGKAKRRQKADEAIRKGADTPGSVSGGFKNITG